MTDATDNTNLPGVTVLIKGSSQATTTDPSGNYTIEVPSDQSTLVFSFVGFVPQEVPVGNRTTINVALTGDAKALDEVVVIGYGTVKKSDVTGSVGSVSSEELTAFPVPNPVMGLQGKTPGVHVMQNSGAPGVNVSVRIRGGNSLLGNNEPLYVIDGFPLSGNPNAINPNDIESIEVLKDASATAIYGSRGANGVVLITTKSGKAGKTQVTFDSYYGVQQVTNTIELMNAREFAEIANERAINDGFPPYFTQDQVNSFGEGTDWQKELFRSAPMQNHSINAAGGSEKTQYSISGSYLGQQGIIPNSDHQRISLRANINQKLGNKFNLSYNSTLANIDQSQIDINGQKGGTVLSAVLVGPPTVAPYEADGSYSNVRRYVFSPNELRNPLAMAKERKQDFNTKYILAGTALTYEPHKDFIFRTSVGIETSFTREDNYSSRVLDNTPTGRAIISSADWLNILNENTLTYHKQINQDHDLNLLAGATYQQNSLRNFNSGTVTGFLTDQLETNNLQSGSVPGTPESGTSEWVLASYLGRVNYAYKGTYLLTASIRSDGSSRFGVGNKWGYFPSAAFAWRVINQDFAKNISQLSDLKLRLSWGITGSTAVDPYQTLNSLTSYRTVFNDARYIGYAPNANSLANPDLKWETTAQYNAGLDLGLFQNRLNLTFDVYRKDTRDLLAFVQLPTSTGYASTISNIGKIRNTGVELGLNTAIFNTAFKWDLGVNFSRNRSEVIQLASNSDVFGEVIPQPLAVAINLVRVGQPVGVFYGYLEDGLDEKGAIKYKDIDGQPGITANDRTIIGDPNPDFLYNFTSNMSFKNFDLNFIFQGKQGGDIFNVNTTAVANSFYWGENQLKDFFNNHWSPANPDPNAKYPKVSSKTIFSASDRFVEDGSFLKLRNVQLGYNLPVAQLGITWLKNLNVYVSGQNLLTITKYSWYDPEVNTRGGSNSISMGIDNAGYPNAKMYTFGVRFTL
ncbi:SusC/RagA family TonB-linked outer membrane protein [Adhaeribacter aerolatus]|uniref:SusC/RagA family TonB-linked outer membrane protein n=1 Tax=Adhaeribacter aerolatus TaxID=670289 RepID=A0A512AXM7_9BACT|nr:SusC/RagA family TonB-linked outer membrane protein [Adhaeribacter aerolatus]